MSMPDSTCVCGVALGIGVEHVVVVDLDIERVLADELEVRQPPASAGMGVDHRADEIAVVVVALAVAGNAGVGVDADQAEPAVEPHRLDRGDRRLSTLARRQVLWLRILLFGHLVSLFRPIA